jgi:hypothetical protein
MANFTPPKKEASKAKGSLAHDTTEHESPPTLYLHEGHLKKLGVKELLKVGSKIKISGLAHVGSTSENQDHGDGGKRRSITLHMHKMEIGRDEHDHEESQKAGMKGAIDKALTKGAGSESEDDGEND